MYKFRSMGTNAEELLEKLKDKNEMFGPMFKMKEDPKLFNVIKGDMSLVGPRPNLPDEVAKFSDYHKLKLRGKLGLTCY